MKIHKVNSEKLFFTSDLHFNHANIIKFCTRPYENYEEMNLAIIENWNKVVPKDGIVYILGDVSMKGIKETDYLLDQLNGTKILIIGNHDNPSIIKYFDKSFDMLGLNVTDNEEGTITKVVLCHFPILEWYGMSHGSIHLHGHVHGAMNEYDKFNWKRLDVGMDSHNMTPVSWNDTKIILNKKYLIMTEHERQLSARSGK